MRLYITYMATKKEILKLQPALSSLILDKYQTSKRGNPEANESFPYWNPW